MLIAASGLAGAGVLAGMAAPFVTALMPPERSGSQDGPLEIDLNGLLPGHMLSTTWQGKPLWVVRRTPAMLATLANTNPRLLDPDSSASEQPDYCRSAYRSIEPEFWVGEGLCTHMGCIPLFQPLPAADWAGGFVCPCHGARFDLAGRVFAGSPAPRNLAIPQHCFLSAKRLRIGTSQA